MNEKVELIRPQDFLRTCELKNHDFHIHKKVSSSRRVWLHYIIIFFCYVFSDGRMLVSRHNSLKMSWNVKIIVLKR